MTGAYDHTRTPVGRVAQWLDVRLGLARISRSTLRYVFPEHFSFLFGEVALYSFVVLVGTGVFLTLFYTPSDGIVTYTGSYAPLRGLRMSEAYHSVVELSFSVRAGLLMRQTHHWAALVFLGAIVAHLARVFFTGAFRRPRELNWMTGVILFVIAMLEGFIGYSLLDDLLSGAGLRIGFSAVQSIPVIGTWLVFLIWGGEFPGEGVLSRMFVVHIFVFPVLLAVLIGVHLVLIVRNHHTQFPGSGRTERNAVGARMWPTYAAQSGGLFFLVAAVLGLAGGFLQINPVWLYGPFNPFTVTSGAQADWYVLWVQGALRLMPPWELSVLGYTVPNIFFPGIVFPTLAIGLIFLWPFVEARVTGDHRTHHLADRPRRRPVRSGIGAAGITVLAVLLLVGSDDVVAAESGWSVVAMRTVERVLVFVLPMLVGLVTYRICRDLAAREQRAEAEVPEAAAPALAQAQAGPAEQQRRRALWPPRGLLRLGVAAALAAAFADRVRRRS